MDASAIPVRNPRTGATDFMLVPPSPEEVAARCAGLRAAQPSWAAAPLEHRISVMRAWAANVNAQRDAIVEADSRDTGYGQISRIAPDMVIGFVNAVCAAAPGQIEAAKREGVSRAVPSISYKSVLKPFPLVGVLSPWNAPTMLTMYRAITPLVAGCAVMVKASEVTPRYVDALEATLEGVPELKAVLGFLKGDGATGQELIKNADFISLTGSVGTGRKVAAACGERLIPFECELGGKDPLVVLEGADLDAATSAALRGAVTSTGQVCFSIERIYVARPIHDAFVGMLKDKAERIRLNDDDPQDGQLSPFTFARQAEIVDAHLADATAKGATILTGGPSFERGGGLYMRPTLLTGVTHEMTIMKDETFGPVMPVMAFDTADEAVALANDTAFGLSAAVMGPSVEAAEAVAVRINAGNVSVQDAFLTFAAGQAESDSFGVSGVGVKRSGVQRYLRRQALLTNSARPACLLEQDLAAAS